MQHLSLSDRQLIPAWWTQTSRCLVVSEASALDVASRFDLWAKKQTIQVSRSSGILKSSCLDLSLASQAAN